MINCKAKTEEKKEKNNLKEKLKKEKAITLIALIITIIILVILVAVSIRTITNNGIVGHAVNGLQDYAKASKSENEIYSKIENDLTDVRTVNNNINTNNNLSEYVKEGLILWYDGIQNTRNGNNPNSDVWEDLSGNNNDGILSDGMTINQNEITESSKGYYSINEKGYVFWHNDAFIQSINNLGIDGDDVFTVEIVYEPYSEGTNYNYSSYQNGFPLWFGEDRWEEGISVQFGLHRTDNKISCQYINSGTNSTESYVNLYDTINTYTYRKKKQGKINSGDTEFIEMNLNGETISSKTGFNGITAHIQASPLYVGRSWQFWDKNRTGYCAIQSVRIYNRVLTDNEIKKNYNIDKTRFVKAEETEEDDSDIVENIYTKSTGGFDAALTKKTFKGERLIGEKDILYTTVIGSNKCFQTKFLEIHYNQNKYKWELIAKRNLKYTKANFDNYMYIPKDGTIEFPYSTSVNYMFYPSEPMTMKIKNDYFENVYTYSIGGNDASLQLEKYRENVLKSSDNILYKNVNGRNNSVKTDLIEIYYSPWTIIARKNIVYNKKGSNAQLFLQEGQSITFNYTENVDYEFYEIEYTAK